MEREPRILTAIFREIPFLQVWRVGEVGVLIKRHKKVPPGIDPDDKSLKRWHTFEFYSKSYRDKP